jgi:two-component system response regulator
MNQNRVILLVEDNPSDIDLTKRALQKGRMVNPLVVVEDGQEALDYLFGTGRHEGHTVCDVPALALLDLKLPKVPGLEVLRRIRADARTKRLPVVILTSSRENHDLAGGYDGGANSYVVKPVDFKQFQHAIEQMGRYWTVLNETLPGSALPESPGLEEFQP